MDVFVDPEKLAEKLEERQRHRGNRAAAVAYAVGRPPGGEQCVVRFAITSPTASFDCDVITPYAAVLDVSETVRMLEQDPPTGTDGDLIVLEAPAQAVGPAPAL